MISPAVNNAAARAQLAYNFLSPGRSGPKDLLGFVTQAPQLQDVPAQYATDTTTTSGGSSLDAGGGTARDSPLAVQATQRANVINAQKLPYQWGGGHAGQTALHDAVPLDARAVDDPACRA